MKRRRIGLVIRDVYALFLAGAKYNHIMPILAHAVTLFIKPRFGVVMLLAIMFSDVAHNGLIQWIYGGDAAWLIGQTVFLGFVCVACRFVWRAAIVVRP